MADPDVLSVHEPSLGEGPEVTAADREQWEELREDDTTTVMITRPYSSSCEIIKMASGTGPVFF
ncbi:hypothetical protein BT96DRAFT_919789 [Gymnopus androsaceus JB14]|uniref:Uncharacterized protein n=1 Tax=Gymnopus androsaceus JB14 TaxID=1447944 RepID=A0A6A4HS53_9AGAR|nr:hypothetical protein BT96DRAFT_919789 [Gymnopus androsaceus JB14]